MHLPGVGVRWAVAGLLRAPPELPMSEYATLRRSRDLDRVFQRGRWHRGAHVSVGVFPRDDEGLARVAFTAGRRTGKAVRRNRARRRMREALRTMHLPLTPGADIVLLARQDTARVPFAELRSAIRDALVRLGVASADAPKRDSAP